MKLPLYVMLFLIPFTLFAQWDQELIPLNDSIYEEIELQFRLNHQSLPTASRPWTRNEARYLIEQLSLSSEDMDRLLSLLDGKRGTLYQEDSFTAAIPIKAGLDLQGWWIIDQQGEELETYPFTRTSRFKDNFFEVPLSFSLLQDRLYLEMNLNFREDLNTDWESPENLTNLPLAYYDLDLSFPQQAYASVGGKQWNFLSGRVLQDWGSARTGNMLVADNASFHELLRFKTWFDNFNYTWAMVSMDPRLSVPQAAYYNDPEPGSALDNKFNGEKYLLLHDFEFRPAPSVRIGLTEGLLLGGEDFNLNPNFFNPMMLFHNWFTNTAKQGNAIHMLELDWTVHKQLFYFQACLDQFQSDSEKESAPYAANEPGAFGYLLGVNRMQELGQGYLSFSLEGAWTMPYLYTSDGYYTSHSINEYHSSSESFYKTWPMGYVEGNDALVFALMGFYRVPEEWSLESSVKLVLKGALDVESPYPFAPNNPLGDILFPTGPVNKRWIFTLQGHYQLSDHLRVEAGNILVYQENPDPLYTENGGLRYQSRFWAVEPWLSMAWQL